MIFKFKIYSSYFSFQLDYPKPKTIFDTNGLPTLKEKKKHLSFGIAYGTNKHRFGVSLYRNGILPYMLFCM